MCDTRYIEPKQNGRNTVAKVSRANPVPNSKPFVKGSDPRRNLKGRPKSFDEVRAIAQKIANETESNRRTAIENVLRRWKHSIEPSLQRAFVEYAFGKVPDKIEATGLENKTTLVLKFDHERPELAGRN